MLAPHPDDVTSAAEVISRARQVAIWRAMINSPARVRPPEVKTIVVEREALMFAALANPVRVRECAKPIRAFRVEGRALMPERVSIKVIIRVVADHFALAQKELTGTSRRKDVVKPRQIVMYLGRTMTETSYPEIGRRLGGKDHTTIMHGFKQIEARILADDSFRTLIEYLEQRVRSEVAR